MKQFARSLAILVIFVLSGVTLKAQRYDGYQYLAPKPNAKWVAPTTIIIIRFQDVRPSDIINLKNFISVTGSQSQSCPGSIRLASDKKTINFKPFSPFTRGETVRVRLSPQIKGQSQMKLDFIEYTFSISESNYKLPLFNTEEIQPMPPTPLYNQQNKLYTAGKAGISANGVAIPADFPLFNISANTNPADGYIFLNNWGNQPYNMILNNDCSPVWYWRTPDRRRDFKVQKVGNDSILTMLVRSGYPFGQGYIALDKHYTVIDSFYAINGYSTDEHELQVLADGSYFLIGIRYMNVESDSFGMVSINESAFQEFTPEGDLILEWRALDHFELSDMDPLIDVTQGTNNFTHMNSVDIDDDGNIVLSSRHISEVTKIDRQTGDIIWRMGGKNNQFIFVDDPQNGFSFQHDFRVLGNGHYTLFDNGNGHTPPISRAVEYVLDTQDSLNMTATLVWEYPGENLDYQAHFMGNVQRLPNGNTFINWAEYWLPKAMEVTPEGEKVYEMNFRSGEYCYRAFRFPWHGLAELPYLVAESHREGVVLIMNKFGDPDVAYYRIYGDQSQDPITELATSQTPVATITNLENDQTYYFRVKAVNNSGQESGFSNVENARVKMIAPGENMVLNGDFSKRNRNWTFYAAQEMSASASMQTSDSICHIAIANGGDDRLYIYIYQQNMELLQGEEYRLEFDAWADEARIMEAVVINPYFEPWIQYAKIGVTAIDTVHTHYAYSFTMEDLTNYDAFLVFFMGGSNADVYLDNISLKKVVDTHVIEITSDRPLHYELQLNYPNPFNTETIFRFSVPVKSRIKLSLYDILGRHVTDIVQHIYNVGEHTVRLDGSRFSSGTYFCRMTVQDAAGKDVFTKVRKIILIK
jgi:hypothetical protein